MKNQSDLTPAYNPVAVLKSGGRKIPLLGFGTAAFPKVDREVVKTAVLEAIKLGYRHFDTATLYYTEEPIGEAIAEAVSQGLIKSREDLFITTKLWCSDAHPGLVLPALKNSLKNIKLDYIDLYLIHWPVSAKPGTYEFPMKKEDFTPMDFKAVWADMEECQRKGLTRSIGVSNFSSKKLSFILANAQIPPDVNQVEFNPLWQQKKLREFCEANGVLLTAYSVLGASVSNGGSSKVMECEQLKEIARAKGKTVAQICLRWAYEQRVCVLAKSFNKERMKENLEIFDWELTEEELRKIDEIPQSRGYLGEDYISEHRPYQTFAELWDGEL
ncbi:non-functional NADPH-dependent codeinone reductase 2-like [Syzygium oleosum]|uniref:non-functional NADPH-dependent codeinone reductase 2-like n=1 Tax=Syzygium oleosum TaxID=219896 RepID=UPI0011D2C687|nr:non-functional NADPH-dependent codeinone reductase 2-like [Syzygium oleosum]XP_056165130.1 non-functional NADPH-dependent codeinone reductase 2-like [Syzygium oleosum]